VAAGPAAGGRVAVAAQVAVAGPEEVAGPGDSLKIAGYSTRRPHAGP